LSEQINSRFTNNFAIRYRGYVTADAREQTAYGTARGYIDVGVNESDVGTPATETSNTFSSNRAFLQWAGFTSGLTQSFFDFYSGPAMAYRAASVANYEDTGDGGWWVAAYTAQLGNGLSASISAENRRTTQIIGVGQTTVGAATVGLLNGALLTAGLTAATGYGGFQSPDIVGNLRVDQTWGSAQVMGALHEVNPGYYQASTIASANGLGHASDSWGWVAGAGLRLNFPVVAQGDYFQGEINYTQGALRYLGQNATANFGALNNSSNQQGFGLLSDCVYGANAGVGGTAATGTGCNLTTAWAVVGGYEHYWTPQVHESFVAGYEAVNYNSQANNILCSMEGGGNGAGVGTAALATPGCSNNYSWYSLSSRLQWDVTKSFYLGVEVLYEHLNSATTFNGLIPTNLNLGVPGPSSSMGGAPSVGDQNAWLVTARMHKDFLP
jgi:hypothetical protein